jgi:RNA polymerase sigma-70 factor (ECF subfamily)
MPRSTLPEPDGARFAAALAGARSGDHAAISTLYGWFNPGLVRFLQGRAGDEGADLAQETWMSAFTGLAGFDGDAHQFRAWLFTIARRRVVDHWRRAGRRLLTVDASSQLERTDGSPSAVEGITAREAVEELVRHLSPEQADVVLLRVVAGLSVEEVAAIVERTPGAVRVIQHRALRRLAAELVGETSGPSRAIPGDR